MSNKLYSRGSEWRRWDLHVHTPKSIIQHYGGDNEAALDAFVKQIALLPKDIKVLGITDYLFCDGYEYLLTRRSEISNIALIILNIEFRLNTFSGTANNSRRHNFHVLFDPSVSIEDIRGQFLNCLATGYKIQDNTVWEQTPTPKSLADLGRQIKAAAPAGNSIHSKSDIEVGFDNITYSRDAITKLLQKNCFNGKYVTAIGYSEWDNSRWDQSAAEKRDLINTAHFCLTSLDDPGKISDNRDDLERNKLNSIVLHSSDAHDISQIGKTALWIKADPTFAGLKQILNEPALRIHIGITPPNYKPDHRVITKVSIPTSSGWFDDNFSLELNRDLVTIIGGRGSGKSALAEAIAYGAGCKDNNDNAFLRKAAKHKNSITGTEICLDWGDGTTTKFKVGTLENNHGAVQYLPQGAVEELCSPANSEELKRQIENVIFQALDETDKRGASDFEELAGSILGEFQYEKEQIVSNIRDINAKIYDHGIVLNGLPEKENHLKEKKVEQEKLVKSMPDLPPEDKKGQEELLQLLESKKVFETKIIELQSILARISEIEAKVKVFKSKIKEYEYEMGTLLSAVGLSEAGVFSVTINESGIRTILEEQKAALTQQISTIKSGNRDDVLALLKIPTSSLAHDNLQALNHGIDSKRNETRAFETSKLRYQQQRKAVFDLENAIQVLESEIIAAKDGTKPAIEHLVGERLSKYVCYFELLKKEQIKMTELYGPLQSSLLAGTDTDKKLVFEAQINYRLNDHIKKGLDVIDRTRKGNFRESNSLKKTLNEMAEEFSRGDYERAVIEGQLKNILDRFTTLGSERILIKDQLRESITAKEFDEWLYDPSYFEIASSLQFNGTHLYLLSPGQKGIILLMLYLEIDKTDCRPLIVDQPEENLDNLSVYKDVIGYFKERKQYRQIIMVTHNPNLVVNTDSEQIIVANYHGERTPRLGYCSGSLEDQATAIPEVNVENLEDGIIEQVCSILEGGDVAFNKRKKKYMISCKILK